MQKNSQQDVAAQSVPLNHNVVQHGFLLTRHTQDVGNFIRITLWVKTLKGPAKLVIDGEKALFFILSEHVEFTESLLKTEKVTYHRIQSLPLKTFQQASVSACYFHTLRDFYRARDLLKPHGVTCYEDDFRPDERYLMERFITADLYFNGQVKQVTPLYVSDTNAIPHQALSYATYTGVKTKQFSDYQSSPIALSMISLDIECSMQGELYSIGLYGENYACVFMIGDVNEPCHKHCPDYIYWVADETSLLRSLIDWITEHDPDIFIGWNVVNFDFDLLQKRCDLHNIEFVIGRDARSPYWRQHKNSEQKYLEISGRVVLDGIDLLKTATYNFPSFALDNVAHALLGKGKLIDDVENRGAEITEKFLHNKLSLAQYNLADCQLVWEIFAKTQLLDFAKLRAQLTGLSLDRMGGSVAAFTNLYLPKLHRSGYVAPNMGDGASGLVSPGGYVMDSVPGLYSNVLVLDFKSLYPSIIRTFNIDPMGLIEGLQEAKQLGLPETFDALNTSSLSAEPIKGFDHAYFSRKEHFLPHIIKDLWGERDKAKADNNSALSQAIKIIMNSFYGVLGSTGCRFFDPRLSGSITKRSHALLKTTKAWIEEVGYQVIYGDTDSIFIHIGKDKSLTESRVIGSSLENLINQKMTATLAKQYQVESALEIEFETHFSTFLMPTIRGLEAGSNIGSKKRYAGMVIEVDGNGKSIQKMVYKGLETVRTDWTELAKEFQQHLYLKVFNHEDVTEYVKHMVAETLAGNHDDKLIYRKRIRRKLTDYVKNVPPHVKAARKADEINQSQGKPLKYQKARWIEYYITLNGPQAKEHLNAPLDYQLYIDRQLATVADAILPFVGTSFSQIIDKQLSLFE